MLINSQLFRFLNHSPPPWAKFVIYDKAFLTPRSPTPTNPVWPSVPTVVLRTRVSSAPLPRAAFLHDSRRRGQPRLSPLRSPGAGSTVDPSRGSRDPGPRVHGWFWLPTHLVQRLHHLHQHPLLRHRRHGQSPGFRQAGHSRVK